MLIRILVCFAEILICFLLQTTVFPHIALAGVVPDLLLIVIVTLAYTRGRIKGLAAGFFCGLLMDLCYGELIGIYALMYMVIGYLTGYGNRIYDEDDITVPLLLIGVSELVYNLMYFIIFFLLQGKLNLGFFLYRFTIPRIIYTVLISILLFKLFNYFSIKLSEKIKTRETLPDNHTDRVKDMV